MPSCMRAPPDADTTMAGIARLQRRLEAARDLLADHAPHAAAHEAEVEEADGDPLALDAPEAPHRRLAQPGLDVCRLEAIHVRLRVVEAERIERLEAGITLLEAVAVQQQVDPLPDRHPEVVAAGRADSLVPLELAVEDLCVAARALRPRVRGTRAPSAEGELDGHAAQRPRGRCVAWRRLVRQTA